MRVLSDITGRTLELIQPKLLKNNYELRLGEEVLGKMVFPKTFSTRAEITFFSKRWELKKESFWKGTLGLHKFGFEQPSAEYITRVFKPNEIHIYGGTMLFVKINAFKHRLELLDRSEKVFLRVDGKGAVKKKFLIEILSRNKTIDENPWLVFMAAYVMMERETGFHAHAAIG